MPHHAELFASGSLFDHIARTVCAAGCLPRKELYEAWEVARRARRRLKGGRVVDMACGHGLLASLMLIIDDTSPTAIAHDVKLPPSAAKLQAVLEQEWPRLQGRVTLLESDTAPALASGDVVVSCHACGSLTDDVIAAATAVTTGVAVLPCCHAKRTCDAGGLDGWLEFSLAVDAMRAARLQQRGYTVWTQHIPVEVTPKNRLLIARPSSTSS